MKVLYITAPPLFDLEISLVRELAKIVDIKVVSFVNAHSLHSSAFSIGQLEPTACIRSASEVADMKKYDNMIDLSKWFLAFNPTGSVKDMLQLSQSMKKFINRERFDIVHNTTYSKELFFSFPYLASIPAKLMTIHDPIPHESIGYLEKIRLKIYQLYFQNRLLLSHALLEDYLNYTGFARDTIFFSKLSVYDFLSTYPADTNKIGDYILFFGRISYYKGVELLIEAYKQSGFKQSGIKLIIAGKGDLDCEVPGVEDGIIFLNRYIENSELANLIRYSKFVVLPYRSATQSGCVMSAFAFNKPILATRVGDLPLEIEHNKTGIIVEPNSVSSLLNGLLRLNNKTLLDTLTLNIESKYKNGGDNSWEHIAKEIKLIYSRII